MTRRPLRVGAALAGLYAAVVVATGLTTGHPVRPLFDAAGGRRPVQVGEARRGTSAAPTSSRGRAHQDIAFENGASPLIGVTSEDAQIILNLPQGALPARSGETAVRASFTPLDPKKLAKPPGGMRPNGNAYRVEMAYQPSGAAGRRRRPRRAT